jgi:alpha-galactosidase
MAWTFLLCVFGSNISGTAEEVELADLDLTNVTVGWGSPEKNANIIGEPITIAGKSYDRGLGAHANSTLWIDLHGSAKRFTAMVGVTDSAGERGSVVFRVLVDGKKVFESGTMHGGGRPEPVDVDLSGKRQMLLLVSDAGDGVDYDHAVWADARLTYAGQAPQATRGPQEEKVILTPQPGPVPRIHGPRLFGVRSGRPFIYRIPCTGERPIAFRVDNLPDGLTLDAKQGIITGHAPEQKDEYVVTFHAKNQHGEAAKQFTLVVGDKLALTPPMGWNSWYIHYNRVTEQHMRAAADQMIASGMADVGYMYVNIDDCWMKERNDEPYRDEEGAMLPNRKFPDIQDMVAHIHSHGLRAGLYTSPGPWTCGGYLGSYEHEAIDAKTYAAWGFDFLKYDWCSYSGIYNQRMKETPNDLIEKKRPYQKMGDILQTLNRDIVLNLCQYGMSDVWTWGEEVGGHCWRTTGDLGLERGSRLPGFYRIGISNMGHWQHAGPGAWNDPDYILIGWVGAARGMKEGRPTTLTGNEQYSYMSMWSLMAAPLIFSGDMAKLDAFTLNVLCNPEVIEVNQDALGKQARPICHTDDELVLVKPMEDGSVALGLFNLGEVERELRVTWEALDIKGPHRVRDVWRHKDLEDAEGAYSATVARHGVMFVRLWPR